MEYYRDHVKLNITPEKKLKAIVVGAGIAGLATGIGMPITNCGPIVL